MGERKGIFYFLLEKQQQTLGIDADASMFWGCSWGPAHWSGAPVTHTPPPRREKKSEPCASHHLRNPFLQAGAAWMHTLAQRKATEALCAELWGLNRSPDWKQDRKRDFVQDNHTSRGIGNRKAEFTFRDINMLNWFNCKGIKLRVIPVMGCDPWMRDYK